MYCDVTVRTGAKITIDSLQEVVLLCNSVGHISALAEFLVCFAAYTFSNTAQHIVKEVQATENAITGNLRSTEALLLRPFFSHTVLSLTH